MITKKMVTLLVSLLFLFSNSHGQDITLIKKGRAKSRIVIPGKSTELEQKAASVMQDYIHRISGAKMKIVTDGIKTKGNEILIGKVNRDALVNLDFDILEEDGFIIRTTEKQLIIAGGTEKGTLYGVYSFLENHLGCRKFTSKASYTPRLETIIVGSIDDIEIPWFKFRETYYRDVFDPEFMDWHKLDGHGESSENAQWGFWCHSFNTLVPPEFYGETHPEYYSMIEGKRKPGSQLCLTNPDVFDITYTNLKAEIEKNPDPIYWSVSQNDNTDYCRCPECKKLNDAAGGPIGSILPFINKLAGKFPDKTISTLSYWYSTTPPKNLVPVDNVNIMLCNIGSPRHIPIEVGDSTFSADLKGWSQLTDNILIWDYVIQFKNLVSPFPNLRTLQPNIQYFRENNVTALFEQGNREIGGEFFELRAYLLAKLMWNTDIDIDHVMDDFLVGYYGPAGVYIREYIDILHDEMEKSGAPITIFGKPADARETFLSDSLIMIYNKIFDNAEEVVSNQPDLLERVKMARLPVIYAILEIARTDEYGRNAFESGDDGLIIPKTEVVEMLNAFVEKCNKTDVTRISEWHTTPDEYLEKYNLFLENKTINPEMNKIIAYVAGWVDFDLDNIDHSKLTHINYAFANIVDGKSVMELEQDSSNLATLVSFRDTNHNLKILLSVGGWAWSDSFSDVALTVSSREIFTESIIELIKRHQLDGVDIDWEYPGQRAEDNVCRPADRDNFTLLLKELREKLDILGKKTGNKHYLVTIASGSDQNYFDNTNLRDAHWHLDFINMMTYDYYNGWMSQTGHHANLHPSEHEKYGGNSVVQTVDRHLKAGVPVGKLVLGIPFYGRKWEGVHANGNGLYQPAGTTGVIISYNDIVNRVSSDNWVSLWDNTASAPYLWNPGSQIFISYESIESIGLKVDYLKDHGFGGTMFWEYSNDHEQQLLNRLYSKLNK